MSDVGKNIGSLGQKPCEGEKAIKCAIRSATGSTQGAPGDVNA